VCDKGYITWKNSGPCSYEQFSQQTTFLLSFFLGGNHSNISTFNYPIYRIELRSKYDHINGYDIGLGVDWFVLAKGNAGYIVAGVFKLLTMGGFGIWWLFDVIRLGINKFNDGNGVPLKPW
jgi:hypothetical protein